MRPINARMLVIIRPEDYDRCLDPKFQGMAELRGLLHVGLPDGMIVSGARRR